MLCCPDSSKKRHQEEGKPNRFGQQRLLLDVWKVKSCILGDFKINFLQKVSSYQVTVFPWRLKLQKWSILKGKSVDLIRIITLQMSSNHDVIGYQVHVERELTRCWCNNWSVAKLHEMTLKWRSTPGSSLWPQTWIKLIVSYFRAIKMLEEDESGKINP